MAWEVLLLYSFLYGMLHGLLPDEHTSPLPSATRWAEAAAAGIAGRLLFSLAFTIQRAMASQIAYFVLKPFFNSEQINPYVYLAVGLAMSAAGAILLHRTALARLTGASTSTDAFISGSRKRSRRPSNDRRGASRSHQVDLGPRISGRIRIRRVYDLHQRHRAPNMPRAWMGFLPGLLFGLGTMVVLLVLGALFGAMCAGSSR